MVCGPGEVPECRTVRKVVSRPWGYALTVFRWWAEISTRPAWKEAQHLVHKATPMYAQGLKPYSA
jgi:hypothetical protein